VWALRGCALEVRAGDRIAVVGRTDSGKSTLLQCIAGLRTTDAGKIDSNFARIVYTMGLPLPVPPVERGAILYLVDDLALAADLTDARTLSDWSLGPRSALVVATRHLAQVASLVNRVFTLRDGRLTALPRAPVRRVAERLTENRESAH
jgi:hypothetical protein